nr:hypothetical protein [Tanacetum cinerariifolium]
MALPPRDERHQYLRGTSGLGFLFGGLTELMDEGLRGIGLHTAEEIKLIGFDVYWAESTRQIPNKGDLSAYWIGISSAKDFLGTTPSYTSIRDLMLRDAHVADKGASTIPVPVQAPQLPYPTARLARTMAQRMGSDMALPPRDKRHQYLRDAHVADKGASTIPVPKQAPQLPYPTARLARTMAQRLVRVEEDVFEI